MAMSQLSTLFKIIHITVDDSTRQIIGINKLGSKQKYTVICKLLCQRLYFLVTHRINPVVAYPHSQ